MKTANEAVAKLSFAKFALEHKGLSHTKIQNSEVFLQPQRLPSARAAQMLPFSFVPSRHGAAMRWRTLLGVCPFCTIFCPT
jgi:hypothetical protein